MCQKQHFSAKKIQQFTRAATKNKFNLTNSMPSISQ